MTQEAPEPRELVTALRSSLIGRSMPFHVGHLRLQVEAALGPDQSRVLRREVHQVMAAAEEHLPSRLVQVRPLTAGTLARLSSELATTRSWSLPTAERTTRVWAAAMGFENLAAAEWPAYVPMSRPTASMGSLELGLTALPPTPQSAEAAPNWPSLSKQATKKYPRSSNGDVPLGVAQAYSGLPLALFAGLLLGLTLILIVILFLIPPAFAFVLPLAGTAIAMALTRAAGQGDLIASDAGIEFVPRSGLLGRPPGEPAQSCAWADVEVQVGTISTISLRGQAHQVGPLSRAFAEAAAGRVVRP